MLKKEPSKAITYIKTGLKHNIPFARYAYAIYLFHTGKEDEGIDEMKRLVIEHPRYFEFSIDYLEQKLFQKGKFDELEELYEEALEKDKENLFIIGKYAEMMAKKRDKNKVFDLLNMIKDDKFKPENTIVEIKVLSIIDFSKVKPHLDELLEFYNYKKIFKCKECGYEYEKFDFKCPNCYSIDSFVRMWRHI